MLYWELCQVTQPYKMSIKGCLLLLQLWAWWQLPFLRPQVNDPYMFPYHRMRRSGNFGQLEYVGHEGDVDSVRDSRPVGENDVNWRDINVEYIDAWDHRIEFLPIYKSFFSSDTIIYLEYMSWFRSECNRTTGSSSVPTELRPSLVSTQYPSQFTPLIHVHFTNPVSFSQPLHYAPLHVSGTTPPIVINASVDAKVNFNVYGFCDTIHFHVHSGKRSQLGVLSCHVNRETRSTGIAFSNIFLTKEIKRVLESSVMRYHFEPILEKSGSVVIWLCTVTCGSLRGGLNRRSLCWYNEEPIDGRYTIMSSNFWILENVALQISNRSLRSVPLTFLLIRRLAPSWTHEDSQAGSNCFSGVKVMLLSGQRQLLLLNNQLITTIATVLT
ncbi:hypothetical protein Gogos_005563 [Gossypium gossypioides]|uniref:Aminotransferase-like plant mobile domain-containing protein n=1 Tax=Gossypium gossypioides TaxID=34282 RepID=A0A7J9CWK8_GOSGO|nr:hypothetical protein [Gossypium gossypioides]